MPRHVAIIMDGNGRWAKKRHLPRIAGHRRGADSVRKILKACLESGIRYLTLYAFSTENWKRPKTEVRFLMRLFSSTLDKELPEMIKQRVQVRYLGRLGRFPAGLRAKMEEAARRTKNNERITLNIMVNYGGRAEIVDAVNRLIEEGIKNADEDQISRRLYTGDVPDPDLLIRTAAEMRVSNFMLWQIAYTELYVTPVLWPDFGRSHFLLALEEYSKRVRKFGKTGEQIDVG